MKKRIICLTILVLLVCGLAGCGHTHVWQEASCETAKTCTDCGETEGEALGHTWQEAGCETPKTCTDCGKTEGETLGHTWQEATCEEPKLCAICGLTEGEPLGHSITKGILEENAETGEVTYTGTCSTCSAEGCTDAYADWRTLAADWITGEWLPAMMVDGSNIYGFPVTMQNDSMTFNEDGTAVVVLHGETMEGSWYYSEVVETDGTDVICYVFSCDQGILRMAFVGTNSMLAWISNTTTLLYTQGEVVFADS